MQKSKFLSKYALRLQLLAILLLVIAFGSLTYAVLKPNSLTVIDLSIGNWVVSQTTPYSRQIFNTITQLGSYPVVRVMAIVVGLWLLYKRLWREMIMLAALVGITIIVSPYLKELVARTRPALPLDSLYGTDPSFPSGHTFLGTVFFGMIAYLGWRYVQSRWLKWVVVAISGLLIFLIGISRVILEVHFFTDVLGGWIAGGLVFFIVLFLMNSLFHPGKLNTEDTPQS